MGVSIRIYGVKWDTSVRACMHQNFHRLNNRGYVHACISCFLSTYSNEHKFANTCSR